MELQHILDNHDRYDIYGVYDRYDVYDEDDLMPRARLPKRYVRDAMNPFDWWAENEFAKRFRFSKHTVMHFILPQIEPALRSDSMRGLPIPPVQKLLLCLRFYATASFQIVCSDLEYVSQSSASNIVRKVSLLIANLQLQYIKFPTTDAENRDRFRALGRVGARDGIPGVDGAIDCTHVRIVDTPGRVHGEAYRNRKAFFSINVQAIVGPRMEFFDIVARWAGSTHDSRIFRMSRVNMRYRERELTGALLGDSGYPALRYMYTPLLRPRTEAEERYNRAHIKGRNIIERTFGVWKRRFPCLRRGLGNALLTVSNIIVACAVLHNMALAINEELPDVLDDNDDDAEPIVPVDPMLGQGLEGFAVRQALIQAHFLW